ncbi:MAG: translation elongation factor Ts [Proteobacteria bacterium]|nr:translation elongation factor Ts [Pseudomonadota bacterium]
MEFDINVIKQLRDETGAGVMDVRNALTNANGDIAKAKEELYQKGLSRAEKRADREANEGIIYSYIHNGSKLAAMVMLTCETDFVAKTDDFSRYAKDIAMHVSTQDFSSLEELLNSPFIKDESKKISDLISEISAKTGEKVELKKFVRFAI